jgi:hypothetical protein
VAAQICTIYEDEDLVALNKPAGAIFDWALKRCPELLTLPSGGGLRLEADLPEDLATALRQAK